VSKTREEQKKRLMKRKINEVSPIDGSEPQNKELRQTFFDEKDDIVSPSCTSHKSISSSSSFLSSSLPWCWCDSLTKQSSCKPFLHADEWTFPMVIDHIYPDLQVRESDTRVVEDEYHCPFLNLCRKHLSHISSILASFVGPSLSLPKTKAMYLLVDDSFDLNVFLPFETHVWLNSKQSISFNHVKTRFKKNAIFDVVPLEMWCEIFKFLPQEALILNYTTVCKRWQESIKSQEVWHAFDTSSSRLPTPLNANPLGNLTDYSIRLHQTHHLYPLRSYTTRSITLTEEKDYFLMMDIVKNHITQIDILELTVCGISSQIILDFLEQLYLKMNQEKHDLSTRPKLKCVIIYWDEQDDPECEENWKIIEFLKKFDIDKMITNVVGALDSIDNIPRISIYRDDGGYEIQNMYTENPYMYLLRPLITSQFVEVCPLPFVIFTQILKNNQIKKESFENLKSLCWYEELQSYSTSKYLEVVQLSNPSLTILKKFKNLIHLDLRCTYIDGRHWMQINEIVSLQKLMVTLPFVSYKNFVKDTVDTKKKRNSLILKLPLLQELTFFGPNTSEYFVKIYHVHISIQLPKLEKLGFENCVPLESFEFVHPTPKHIHSFNFNSCKYLNVDEALIPILQRLRPKHVRLDVARKADIEKNHLSKVKTIKHNISCESIEVKFERDHSCMSECLLLFAKLRKLVSNEEKNIKEKWIKLSGFNLQWCCSKKNSTL
jgi:hypothetical protein